MQQQAYIVPVCNVCGVEYVEGYEGPCQEPRGAYVEHVGWSSVCPGKVSPRAVPVRGVEAGSTGADLATVAREAAEAWWRGKSTAEQAIFRIYREMTNGK